MQGTLVYIDGRILMMTGYGKKPRFLAQGSCKSVSLNT